MTFFLLIFFFFLFWFFPRRHISSDGVAPNLVACSIFSFFPSLFILVLFSCLPFWSGGAVLFPVLSFSLFLSITLERIAVVLCSSLLLPLCVLGPLYTRHNPNTKIYYDTASTNHSPCAFCSQILQQNGNKKRTRKAK